MSNRHGSSKALGSRLAAMCHITTLSPAAIFTPPSSQSVTAWRRKCSTGVAHRTISSTAVAMCRSGSAANLAHWSGKSKKAIIPRVIELRVVSLPATDRIKKNMSNSFSLRASPSTSAVSRVVTMSSAGRPRRSAWSWWE